MTFITRTCEKAPQINRNVFDLFESTDREIQVQDHCDFLKIPEWNIICSLGYLLILSVTHLRSKPKMYTENKYNEAP